MSKYTLFKDYTFHWWQVGILKFALLFVGIAVGARWPHLFIDYFWCLIIVGLIGGLYMKYVGFKQ